MRVFTRSGIVRSFVLLALLLAAAAFPLLAADQPRVVFGPERVVRATGAPVTVSRTFRIPSVVGPPLTLRIINGDRDARGNVRNAVASATVSIDGQEVVRQNEFSQNTGQIEKTLTLAAGVHTLETRLDGAPDHFFTLTIDGVIRLADLSAPRAGHTATLLGDGSVLIAGGRNASGFLSSAERFDGSALTTAAVAGTTVPRSEHAAATLATPQTLLVGGVNAGGTVSTAEVFGQASGAFTALAAATQISRSGHTATVLRDGRVLILGGVDASGNTLAPAEAFEAGDDSFTGAIYDPATGSFNLLPHALRAARANHTATVLPDGKVLVAGGRDAAGFLDSAELFDPETGQSTLLPSPLTAARAGHSATLRADGSVLIAGGRTVSGPTASIEIFSAASQSFAAGGATLIRARADHSATLLPSGEILVAGGETAGGVTAHTELIGPPGADTTNPSATVFPADQAVDVEPNAIVAIRFSEPVAAGTLGASLSAAGAAVEASLAVGESGLYAFLVPRARLLPGTLYSVVLSGIRDLAGNELPARTTTFATIQPPSIASFTPTHGLPGASVTITGTSFDARAPDRNRVTLGGMASIVTAATATALTVTVPGELAPGPHRFIVETRAGSATSADAFIVDNPAPVLDAISPATASVGGGAVTLTATGSGFVSGASIVFGTTPLATTFVSAAQLTAAVPATLFAAAGVFPVTVTNPEPGGGTSGSVPFEVRASNGSVGDFVWHDENLDAGQSSGEEGVANVTVKLLSDSGAIVATTVTGGDGAYLFTGVAPGVYRVEVALPAGFDFVPANGSNDAGDSDVDPLSGRSDLFAVAAAQELRTIDAGLYRPATSVESSPAHGETDVSVTRETIFRFANPLDASTVNARNIFATFGGATLGTRVHLSPDRRTVTLFYNQDLPASARVRVTLVGDDVRDEYGRPVDADNDGFEGGNAHIDFDTLTLSTVAGTRVCGRVFASELAGNGSVNVPLAGVVVSVDGMETTLRVVTDNLGNFCLDPAPAGKFFVHVDGRTATNPLPAGDYYPVVGKLWESNAGETVNIGEVYLPRVVAGTLQPVSRTADTTITFPASVIAQFPKFAGATLVVPADSLFSDGGGRGGMVGIAPVPPDRIPGPLPNGLEPPLVVTVQTDGGQNFDRPVPICLPNVPDHSTYTPYAPGELTELYSFNHDTGQWEAVGPMHVTADGKLVCSDPGFGVLAPGWHGTQPPPKKPPKKPKKPPFPCPPPNDLEGLNKCLLKVKSADTKCRTICMAPFLACMRRGGSAGCAMAYLASMVCLLKCAFDTAEELCRCKGQYCGQGCNVPGRALVRVAATPRDIANQLEALGKQIGMLLYPYAFTTQPIPPHVIAQIEAIEAQADAIVGGDAKAWLRAYILGQSGGYALLNGQVGDARFNAPDYPVLYLAAIERPNGTLFLRAETLPYGQYTIFVPRDGNIRFVAFYDPKTKTYDMVVPLEVNGEVVLPHMNLQPIDPNETDTDHDGVIDIVEEVYGTDSANPDSDNDGILDGAEIEQGTNPLDGVAVRTGVVGAAPTPDDALDVCAVNDLTAVATGAAGVSVFNVFNGMSPTAVAQVDTPGSGEAVACGGNRIAVADGPAGLAVIDISDPPAARILRQVAVRGHAQAVLVSAGIAYVGTDTGRIVAVDLDSGTILQEVSGLSGVHDLAIEGDTLFVSAGSQLRAYSLSSGSLELTGTVATTGSGPDGIVRRRRLFVGGGTAYVTAFFGYDTVDVRDRTALRVTGRAIDNGPNSFKQIVANGSGLGIAAVGSNPRLDGTHDVWLYDVRNPAVTDSFVTILGTPGVTRAVSIYNGLAYAADGESGLQVVNYLPYDSLGQPPTIQLQTNFAAGVAEEGQIMRLTAVVGDDVQVRNVQFLIDGVPVNDGNFPFEHRFVTPLLAQQGTFTLSACAFDTGGNRTCTDEVRVDLVPDATPPRVTSTTPRNDTSVATGTIAAVSAAFSEPIDLATLGNGRFRLFRAGADGRTGTADDVAVSGGVISWRDEIRSAFLTFPQSLPIDAYRVVLSGAVADLKGNPVGSDTVWTFRVKGPNLWTNTAGGLWHDANNWSDRVIPGASDIAFITLPGNYTVTVSGDAAVQRLVVGGAGSTPTLWVRGANAGGHTTLTVNDSLDNDGLIRLESRDSTWFSGLTVVSGSLLNRGTIEVNAGNNGDRRLAARLVNSGLVDVNYNLPFDGTITNTGTLRVAASQKLALSSGDVLTLDAGTITGAGLVELNRSTLNANGGTTATVPLLIDAVVNFNPAATEASTYHLTGDDSTIAGALSSAHTLWIRGSNAGGHTTVTAEPGFINHGLIRLESVDSTWHSGIAIPAGVLTNRGRIEVRQGNNGSRAISGTVVNEGVLLAAYSTGISGTWTNRSNITVASGQTLSVTGAATVFHQLAGAVTAEGLFDMSGGTFNLEAGTLSVPGSMRFAGTALNFRGGTTSGNEVVLANGRLLYASTSSPAVFAASGDTQVSGAIAAGQTLWVSGRGFGGHTNVVLADGFINAGLIRVESRDSNWDSNLSGNFINEEEGVVQVFAGSGGTRTISGTIRNDGTFHAGYPLALRGTFTNHGTVSVAASQSIIHAGTAPVFVHNGGTFALTGAYELRGGRLDLNGGTTTGTRLPVLLNSRIRYGTGNDPSTFILTGTGAVEGTINSEQTLWVRGSNLGGHTTVIAEPPVTNNGTIRLESVESTWNSYLAGDVTNDGTVESNEGSLGERRISGTFRNRGTLLVRRTASYGGTLTNSGRIEISADRKLVNLNAAALFVQTGGTVAGAGLLEVTGATYRFDGGTTTGIPPQLVNTNLIFGSSNDEALFVMSGGGTVSGRIAPAQTLWVRGQDLGGHTTVNAAPGFVNDGTIRLQSANSNYQSNLAVPSGVLTNRALIETRSGSGGSRLLSGTIVNEGSVQVRHHLSIAGSFTNRDTVSVIAGQTLTVSGATTVFDQASGTVDVAGVLDMNASTFNFDGGTISSAGQMRLTDGLFSHRGGTNSGNAILLVDGRLLLATSAAPAFFAASGSTQVGGALAAGQTLWVRGANAGGHTTVVLADGFTSAGTIRLESRDSSWDSNLSVPAGSASSTGLVEVRNGNGGNRTITGAFLNAGTLSVGHGLTHNGTLTNTGTIDVLSGQRLFVNPTFRHDGGTISNAGTFEMRGGTFHLNGGGTSGNPPLLIDATAAFGNAGASGLLFSTGGASKITGDIKAGQSLWVAGSNVGGHTTLTAAAGFTNNGTIRIESRDSNWNIGVAVAGTLVNAGRIDVNAGNGGARSLSMGVDNRGLFAVNTGASVAGSFLNASGGTVAGNGTLTLSTAGAVLDNRGTLSPGNSPGTLTVNRVAQAADGSLSIELAAGAFDRLAVPGGVTLGGTLDITLLGGYVPNIGDSFVIATFASRTGTFATVNGLSIGNGRRFDVVYGTDKVTLTVVAE